MNNSSHFPFASFNWDNAWLQHKDCLPHLRQMNVLYFITFRLADSLPQKRIRNLLALRDQWQVSNPLPHSSLQIAEYRKLWTVPIERLLDSGLGDCELREMSCRGVLESTMRRQDGECYQLGDFVIMPNHVHAILHVPVANDLSRILEAWKSISAREINRLRRRRGALWQPESFDHIVRNAAFWQRFSAYIHKNPKHLSSGTFTLGCGLLGTP